MKNRIIKNTSMLYLLNISKMIFPLITLPYLTRVLSVDCYGTVSYVKAVMQYMQLIVDFGFILSGTRDIVINKNDSKALSEETGDILAAKILLSGIAFIVLCGLIVFIPILSSFGKLFLPTMNNSETGKLHIFVGISFSYNV